MSRFQLGDISIHLEGYTAKMVVLSRGGNPPGPNIVIARDAVDADVTVQDYAQAHLEVMAETLEGFEGVRTDQIEIEGETVPLIEVRAKGDGGAPYTTLVTYRVHKSEAFTLSASHLAGPPFEGARAALLRSIQSFHVGRRP